MRLVPAPTFVCENCGIVAECGYQEYNDKPECLEHIMPGRIGVGVAFAHQM